MGADDQRTTPLRPDTPLPEPETGANTMPEAEAADVLSSGARVGRFMVLETIGQGGMGLVYAAYDPQLDRRVALKVLRKNLPKGADGRVRLLREAQAMARVRHPNVVSVFEVGDDFVAMELVDGETLHEWLKKPRTTEAILDVFVQAGRGLAKAHETGVIHRDFKPGNVLVDKSDQPRVTDFGLARFAGSVDPPSDPTSPSPPSDDDITIAGTVMGTPGYISPEQLASSHVDAKSDQFSFSVALFRALVKKWPYKPEVMLKHFSVDRGKTGAAPVQPSLDDPKLPRHVRRVLARGLQLDPALRFPSMDALIGELDRAQAARMRRKIWIGAGALALIALPIAAFAVRERPATCEIGPDALGGAWDTKIRDEIKAAFASTKLPFAVASATRATQTLDTFAKSWLATRTAACRATRVSHVRNEVELSLQNDCLDRKLDELRALAQQLAHPEGTLVQRSVDAAASLSLKRCLDLAALKAVVPPPSDEIRQRAATLRRSLSEISALKLAGKYKQALEATTPVLAEARTLAYAPLLAEVLLARGGLLSRVDDLDAAEQSLYDAAAAADAARYDELRADAAIELTSLLGYVRKRYDEGERWAKFAQATIDRSGGNAFQQVRLLNNRSGILYAQQRYKELIPLFEDALARVDDAFGADHPFRASLTNNLALVHLALGEYDKAIERTRSALAFLDRIVGGDHPDVARTENTLAVALEAKGDYRQALTHADNSWQTWARAFRADHRFAVEGAITAARIRVRLHVPQKAIEDLEAVLELRLAAKGEDLEVPPVLEMLGDALLAAERPRDALARYEQAIAMRGTANAPEADLSGPLAGAGLALVELGKPKDALASLERAQRLLVAGSDPELVISVKIGLARATRRLGDVARAATLRAEVEQALASTRPALAAWFREELARHPL